MPRPYETIVRNTLGTHEFDDLISLNWQTAFEDDGAGDWRDRWFLDGHRATVDNTPDGMVLSAGPIAGDHASHCVLWTNDTFAGDVKIEFDYWRMDTIFKYVNIIYIQAAGMGEAPYVDDISAWSDLRAIPYMRTYYNHTKALHVSFAAYDEPDRDYVRARRYPTTDQLAFSELALPPDNFETGLFEPGVKHHFTFIKHGDTLMFQASNGELTRLFTWDTSRFDRLNAGRIGLRHMATRCSRYASFVVSGL